MREASWAVMRSGGTIRIAADNYNERIILRRPMTLVRDGASGTVVIGKP